MIKSIMKRQVFSSSWVLECCSFLLRKCPLHLLLVMLFIHVGKRLKSRSQRFFKIGVLKNFAIFTGKHLCWRLFLIKLQYWRLAFLLKKTLQHNCFPMNIARFLKTAFLWNTVHYTSANVYVMMDIRYLKVMFCYYKSRPRSRKNFTTDRSKLLVKRCFFSKPRFRFFFKDFFAI